MKPEEELYWIARLYFLARLLTLVSADYAHRHEHSIQMKNYQHPRFGQISIRFCAFNQYLDEHEGRCMIIPGGGTAISIDVNTTCAVEALRPHPTISSNYYACRQTKTILAKCKSGQHFENRLKRCAIDVTSSNADFSGEENLPEAYDHIHLPACERSGRFPVPQGNCTIFYACTSNGFRLFRTIYKCPASTGFDPFTKMCSPEFACDNDSESDIQLTKNNPEPELTTFNPRDAEMTTTTQTLPTIASSAIDMQVTSALNTSTLSSVPEKSTILKSRPWNNSGYDSTTEMIKNTTTSGFNEMETISAAPELNLITENVLQPTVDEIVDTKKLLTISSTQGYENQEPSPTSEATFTPKEVQTSEDPSIDESSSEEISTSNFVRNNQESTTINPNIIGSFKISAVAETTLSYRNGEDEETTVGYFTPIKPETEKTAPSYLSEKSILEQNTPDSVTPSTLGEKWLFNTTDSEKSSEILLSTTEIPATSVPSFIVDEKISDVIPMSFVPEMEATTTPHEILLNDQSSITVKSETMSTLEENTTDSVTSSTLGENLLFDTTRAEESSEMLLSTTEIPPTSVPSFIVDEKISDIIPTSSVPEMEATTTSHEILFNDQSTTTVKSETMSTLEENTTDSVTSSSLGENWLFDTTRAEESSEMLLSTTEIPPTSVPSFIVDEKISDIIPTSSVPEMEATTTSDEILFNDQSTTTVKSETMSTLEENTTDSVTSSTLGENWLFNTTDSEESSEMLSTTTEIPTTSVPNFIVDEKISDIIPTSFVPEIEATTTSDEIFLNDQSSITVKSETMSTLEENTTDSVTSSTSGEKWLFDTTRAEESSEMLLSTTEIPPTSVPSFIVDEKISDIIPTSFVPEMEATTTSDEIWFNDQSTTTIKSETMSTLEENTTDSVTSSTLGESWLFNTTDSEESFEMLSTTTETSATTVPSFILNRKTHNATESSTEAAYIAETEVISTSGEILRNNLLTTPGDLETTTSNILESAIENVVTSTTPTNDYVTDGDFVNNISSTENSRFDENADDKTISVDTTTVFPKISDTESSPVIKQSPENLVTSMTTSAERESIESELTTENSWSSISDAESDNRFYTTSGPLESILPSSEKIEYYQTTETNEKIVSLPIKDLNNRKFNDQTTILPENRTDNGFNDQTTIVPEGELKTSRINEDTTISSDDVRKN